MSHVGPFPKHKLGQVVGFRWNFPISITSLAFRRQHEGKIAPRRKKSTIEMDPSTSVRRPLQDLTNGRMPLPLGLPCALAQPSLSPYIRWRCLRRLWSRIWSLSTSRLLRCLLLSAPACRRNRRLMRGSAREGLSGAAVVDALRV